jgi:hypothetical protein
MITKVSLEKETKITNYPITQLPNPSRPPHVCGAGALARECHRQNQNYKLLNYKLPDYPITQLLPAGVILTS